jgi:hypothetical protein
VSDHVLSLSQNLVPCACRDSRFPPFRNERGKMGHPFVWLGWDSVGRVLGDAGSLDFARDDGLFSGLREWASRHTSAAGSRSAIAYYGTAEAVPFPRGTKPHPISEMNGVRSSRFLFSTFPQQNTEKSCARQENPSTRRSRNGIPQRLKAWSSLCLRHD